jgi:hypothetical protein
LGDGGHWRSLVVRSNEAGQIMAIVVFNPQDMEQQRLEEEGVKLRDYFLHGSGAHCNLSSLYFQPWYDTHLYSSVSVLLSVSGMMDSEENNKIVLSNWLVGRYETSSFKTNQLYNELTFRASFYNSSVITLFLQRTYAGSPTLNKLHFILACKTCLLSCHG